MTSPNRFLGRRNKVNRTSSELSFVSEAFARKELSVRLAIQSSFNCLFESLHARPYTGQYLRMQSSKSSQISLLERGSLAPLQQPPPPPSLPPPSSSPPDFSHAHKKVKCRAFKANRFPITSCLFQFLACRCASGFSSGK